MRSRVFFSPAYTGMFFSEVSDHFFAWVQPISEKRYDSNFQIVVKLLFMSQRYDRGETLSNP